MESLHYLLMRSHMLMQRRILFEASKLGLTSGQPKILDFLWRFGESDQKSIAAHCEIEQTTVGSILLRMEKAELIVRRQKDGNRRSLYVSLTDKGVEAAQKIEDIFAAAETDALKDLSDEEAEELKRMLHCVAVSLSKRQPAPSDREKKQ